MKIKIKIIVLGNLPFELNLKKIENWESKLFEISKSEKYSLNGNSDGYSWEYTDSNISKTIPDKFSEDILFAITNVPLESNYYSRRLSENRVCITTHEMSDILKESNIPIENLILRLIYSYFLAYKYFNDSLPTSQEFSSLTHDETKGCLFDMNGIKKDVIHSTNNPILCSSCQEKLRKNKVSENIITFSQDEIKSIKKDVYYRIIDFIKKHPILSFLGSALLAVILGIIGSLVASSIWEHLLKKYF